MCSATPEKYWVPPAWRWNTASQISTAPLPVLWHSPMSDTSEAGSYMVVGSLRGLGVICQLALPGKPFGARGQNQQNFLGKFARTSALDPWTHVVKPNKIDTLAFTVVRNLQ